MTPPIQPRVFYGGLFILVVGLFIATFLLNRSQYRASAASVGLSLNSILNQQTEILQGGIAQQEATLFSLHNTTATLDGQLFSVSPNSVVPAVTAELITTIPIREAEEVFAGTGRVLVRFSGTEPLARVMIEGADNSLVERFAERIAETIRKELADGS